MQNKGDPSHSFVAHIAAHFLLVLHYNSDARKLIASPNVAVKKSRSGHQEHCSQAPVSPKNFPD